MRTYVRIWPRSHAAGTRAGLAWRGARKRSLTHSGAAAAFVVGFLSFVSSTRSGILLIAVSCDRRISGWLPRPAFVLLTWACAQFYQSGSSLTKWRASAKVRVERVRCVHMRVRVRAHGLKRACLPAVCSCRQTSKANLDASSLDAADGRSASQVLAVDPYVFVSCVSGCAHVLWG
jgi:hypothetical protein